MSNEIVLRAEGLGKKYTITHQGEGSRYKTLRESIVGGLDSVRSKPGRKQTTEEFWALRDINFEIERGEVVGVIGHNGAGKSTLLKIISRVTEPTTGRVSISGRVSSLLEVGTGFHPELTGRENIYLNGAILGMHRQEITRQFGSIVEFAEVERFLDTPVKRFSSGMYLRLAFAVAAHLNPEILVVDEVLAVGDANFQRKCMGKMQEVSQRGDRTILFVSHQMAAVQNICTSAIVLSQGRVSFRGSPRSAIAEYLNLLAKTSGQDLQMRDDRSGSGVLRFAAVKYRSAEHGYQSAFVCGCTAIFELYFENATDAELRDVRFSVGIDDQYSQRILYLDTHTIGETFATVSATVSCVELVVPRLPLARGMYSFTVYAAVGEVVADWIKNAGSFQVEGGDFFASGRLPPENQGLFLAEHHFQLSQNRT